MNVSTSASRGQSGGELRRWVGAVAGPAGGDGVQEVLLDGRVDGGLACGDPFEGLADLGGAGVFGQVAAGTGPQRVDDGPVIGVGGEHQDLDARVMFSQAAGGLDAVRPERGAGRIGRSPR
jgi:hypothetical protein